MGWTAAGFCIIIPLAREVREMSEEKEVIDTEQAIREFGFMFKKISCSKGNLIEWFSVPEFIEGLMAYKNNGITIDNESVYELMTDIYAEKVAPGKGFNKSRLRHTIHQIQRGIKA